MQPEKSPKDDQTVLLIERVFDAPRDLVWKAWTDKTMVLQWGGPHDYPIISTEADVHPGSKWHSVLRGIKDGREVPQGGVYKEVVEPELLVFTFAWQIPDEENFETLVTVRFEDLGDGRTKMHFRQESFNTIENRDGHRGGWSSAFDRLDDLLAA